jgi:hypothetical protein
MKLILTLFIPLVLGFSSFSQEKSLSQKEVKPQAEQSELKKDIELQISNVKSHLNSIEVKRQFILSDEAKKEKATLEGWFSKMEETEKNLQNKLNDLETKLSSLI